MSVEIADGLPSSANEQVRPGDLRQMETRARPNGHPTIRDTWAFFPAAGDRWIGAYGSADEAAQAYRLHLDHLEAKSWEESANEKPFPLLLGRETIVVRVRSELDRRLALMRAYRAAAGTNQTVASYMAENSATTDRAAREMGITRMALPPSYASDMNKVVESALRSALIILEPSLDADLAQLADKIALTGPSVIAFLHAGDEAIIKMKYRQPEIVDWRPNPPSRIED